MTRRLTRLTVSIAGLSALAAWLGVVTGRPELFLVPVPMLIALLASHFGERRPDYSITHRVSPNRVFEGESFRVEVAVTADAAAPMLEVAEPVPWPCEVVTGHAHRIVGLRAGQRVEWSYELRCRGRSQLRLGTLHARLWSPSGLLVHESIHADPKTVRVCPRPLPVRHLPRPARTQSSVGNYVSPRFGEGLEPGDIRRFAPGDRVRRVNWRVSLRLRELHVTEYQTERNADVVLMLDTLAAAGRAPATTLDLSVRAAASLAAGYLRRNDRVGLIDYGAAIRWVRPGSGRAQLERLLDPLLDADVFFTYVAKDLDLVPPRVLPPQALVIALSPLLDPRFVDAVTNLRARGFDVIVLAVSPVDLTRAALPPSDLVDAACRLWAIERRLQLRALRRQGLAIAEWHPDEPLDLALSRLPAGRWRARVPA